MKAASKNGKEIVEAIVAVEVLQRIMLNLSETKIAELLIKLHSPLIGWSIVLDIEFTYIKLSLPLAVNCRIARTGFNQLHPVRFRRLAATPIDLVPRLRHVAKRPLAGVTS